MEIPTSPIEIPNSPSIPTLFSDRISISSFSSSPPVLRLDTLALLNSFYADLTIAEENFKSLADKATSKLMQREDEAEEVEKAHISVPEFRALFGEDWQLSQFWYSNEFVDKLSDYIYKQVESNSKIAFICSPTAFVSFQHKFSSSNSNSTNLDSKQQKFIQSYLFEFDKRFQLLPTAKGNKFIHYDLEEPENFLPLTVNDLDSTEVDTELIGKFDLAIVDPPFLNFITNKNLSKTLKLLLNPTRGRLILITSTSVEHLFEEIYGNEKPLGPLTRIEELEEVEHEGGLANDFKCWSS